MPIDIIRRIRKKVDYAPVFFTYLHIMTRYKKKFWMYNCSPRKNKLCCNRKRISTKETDTTRSIVYVCSYARWYRNLKVLENSTLLNNSTSRVFFFQRRYDVQISKKGSCTICLLLIQRILHMCMRCNTNAILLIQYIQINAIHVTVPSIGGILVLTFIFHKC